MRSVNYDWESIDRVIAPIVDTLSSYPLIILFVLFKEGDCPIQLATIRDAYWNISV